MGSIPFSNPAGNNQTNPVMSLMPKPTGGLALPVNNIGSVTADNPYSPVKGAPLNGAAGQVPMSGAPSPASPSVPNVGGLTTSTSNSFGTTGGLNKQLDDIYGKGVGGALSSLLEGMSGTDSTILQQYIQSLQPQMAKAQANTNAALGAGGVSANSSVAAIADSNLQAQESAAIAGESANLTQSQEQLTAQLLQGMQGAASKEVATSGWQVLGDVLNNVTGDIGNLLPAFTGGVGGGGGGGSSPFSAQQLPSGLGGTAAPPVPGSLSGWDGTDGSGTGGIDMSMFN